MTSPDPSDAPKPRRTRVLGLCLAGLISLVVAFFEVELMRGRGAWRDYEREALARGVKLKFSEYLPPAIPDAENFARTPIIDAIFRASDAGQNAVNPFILIQYASEPKLADLWSQRQTDLGVWQQWLIQQEILPRAGDSPAADVLLFLEHFDAPLLELHEAKRPRSRFPVRWDKGFDVYLPHLGTLHMAVDRYALRLSAHLAQGDSAAAYEDFHDGLRMTTVLREEPSLNSGMHRVLFASKMLSCVWDGLAKRQWAPPELQKIESDLSAFDWLSDCVFTLNSERASATEMMDDLIRHPEEFSRLFMHWSIRYVPTPSQWDRLLHDRIYPAGWIYQSKVRQSRYIDELIARVDPAQHRYFGDRPLPSHQGTLTTVPQRLAYVLFVVHSAGLDMIQLKYLQLASMTDLARIACALESFRQEYGAYPASLPELVPEFLRDIPVEIVNGDPYRYRRTKDGLFLLYSVGTDLRDDGGVVNPGVRQNKQSDWIWSYPPK